MTQLLFRNFKMLEPEVGETRDGFELLVEGDTIWPTCSSATTSRWCARCPTMWWS